MAKKPKGGKHVTPRQPVQVPSDWIKVARALAARHKQPMLWYLLQLLADAADAAQIEHPKLPWEESSDGGD